jgi:hypothetical protein
LPAVMGGTVGGAWSCPGYDVEQLIGLRRHGRGVAAARAGHGDTVALKRLRSGRRPGGRRHAAPRGQRAGGARHAPRRAAARRRG